MAKTSIAFVGLVFGALWVGAVVNAQVPGGTNNGIIESGGGSSSGEYDLEAESLYGDKTNDPDTYLYRSAADEISIVSGGTAIGVYNATTCTCAGALGGVTSLGATTEGTIESALDTLANVTSIQGQTVTLAGSLETEAGGGVLNQDVTSDASPTFGGTTIADDGKFCLGAGCDYWMEYDSGNTRFNLYSNDSDGAGADWETIRINDAGKLMNLGINGTVWIESLQISNSIMSAGSTLTLDQSTTTTATRAFHFDDNGYAMNKSSGVQSFILAEPDFNQAGTAGYNGIFLDLTQTGGGGSGDQNAILYDYNGTSKFRVTSQGAIINGVQSETVADSGDGNPATDTLTITHAYIEYTCNDGDTCDITVSETGAVQGWKVDIINISANTCDFSDSSGVTELAGAVALGQYDSLTLRYMSDRWVQVATSNN